ncbi:uncharacterized protein LOC133036963 [Cannabis sativa]|uniref:uncharacterized protein LOC133036963 n=1 Tax=Cannabis sativa TaxID=3483 RepID=UPI0029CA186C|nr:uncharacterized protein LOC133036963 [Cannabis sativa]
MGHALFSCKYAKAVWRAQNLSFDWRACTSMRNGDYLLHLSSIYNKSEMEQLFCTLWAIWNEQNKVVHGRKARAANDLAIFAAIFLQNFFNAQHKHPTVAATAPTISHQQNHSVAAPSPWSPPASSVLKLNIDATVHSSSNNTGVGAVLKDTNGHVVAALAMPIIGSFKSHEMEAKVLFHSLNWALQQQLQITQIETDALMRSANEAAHGLAKFALGVDETCTWLEIILLPIYSVIVNESLFV